MRGNHLADVWRYTKVFALSLLAATLLLCFFKTFTPVAGAEQPDETPAVDMIKTPEEPARSQLIDGDPLPTSAADLKRDNARLAWTPTGAGEVQDTYDIRVSASNEADLVTGELRNAPISANGLTSPVFDMTEQPATTYYWQVRSCRGSIPCGKWSPVWSVTIDEVAPAEPTATIISESYDQNVRMRGSGEAGSKVIVIIDDTTREAIVDANGTWTLNTETPFNYGKYEALIKSVDKAGNESSTISLPFFVKELFVASQITVTELPVALDIIPIDETVEKSVIQRPASTTIDVVNMGAKSKNTLATIASPLSMDGGIVQSSESGWQVLGLPWFMWAGIGSMLSITWYASTGRFSRSISM